MDLWVYLLLLLGTGAMVGFFSGLLGVGGGFIMGPVQFFLLISLGVDPNIAIRVAFATSLAVILPTAITGAWGHHRKGVVMVKPALYLGSMGFFGSFIGAAIASNISADVLRIVAGVVIIFAALWMLRGHDWNSDTEKRNEISFYLFWGFIGGFSSGLLGIGGGVVMVPILAVLLRFKIHQAIGTSTAFIIFASLGGILAYVLLGLNVPGLPPYSIGYVNLLQWAGLLFTSVPLALVGVQAAHRLPERQIRYLFIVLLLYIGLKMMGVFEWLGLPL